MANNFSFFLHLQQIWQRYVHYLKCSFVKSKRNNVKVKHFCPPISPSRKVGTRDWATSARSFLSWAGNPFPVVAWRGRKWKINSVGVLLHSLGCFPESHRFFPWISTWLFSSMNHSCPCFSVNLKRGPNPFHDPTHYLSLSRNLQDMWPPLLSSHVRYLSPCTYSTVYMII